MRLVVWLKIGAQRGQHAFEDDNNHQAYDQNVQGCDSFVHQNFVHYDLEEQGAYEAKELQRKGNHPHFAQQFAVLDQCRYEPREVELARYHFMIAFACEQPAT